MKKKKKENIACKRHCWPHPRVSDKEVCGEAPGSAFLIRSQVMLCNWSGNHFSRTTALKDSIAALQHNVCRNANFNFNCACHFSALWLWVSYLILCTPISSCVKWEATISASSGFGGVCMWGYVGSCVYLYVSAWEMHMPLYDLLHQLGGPNASPSLLCFQLIIHTSICQFR